MPHHLQCSLMDIFLLLKSHLCKFLTKDNNCMKLYGSLLSFCIFCFLSVTPSDHCTKTNNFPFQKYFLSKENQQELFHTLTCLFKLAYCIPFILSWFISLCVYLIWTVIVSIILGNVFLFIFLKVHFFSVFVIFSAVSSEYFASSLLFSINCFPSTS